MKQSPAYPAAWLFLCWIALGGAFMFLLLLPQAEDLWKYYQGAEYLRSIGCEFTWPSLIDGFIENYIHPNGRICEGAVMAVCWYFPRWLIAVVWFVTLLGILMLGTRLSSAGESGGRRPLTLTLFGVLFLLSFPFNSPILLVSYFMPYGVGGCMALGCMALFLHISKKQLRPVPLAAATLLMLLTGCWQESNAAILLAYIAAVWFTLPQSSCRQGLILASGLFLGLIVDIVAPGLHERSLSMPITFNPFGWFQPQTLTGGIYPKPYLVLPVGYMVIAAILLCFRRVRKNILPAGSNFATKLRNIQPDIRILAGCTAGICASLALALLIASPWTASLGNILACIALTILCRRAAAIYASRLFKAAVTILAILLSANILTNLLLQRRISAQHRNITDLYISSTDGTVYYDTLPLPDTNPYPWQWTRNDYTSNPYTLLFLKDNPQNNHNAPLSLLPTALRPDSLCKYWPNRTIHTIASDTIINLRGNLLTTRPFLSAPTTEAIPGQIPYLKYNIQHLSPTGTPHTIFYYLIPLPAAQTSQHTSPLPTSLYYLRPVLDTPSQSAYLSDSIISILPAAYW